MTFTLNQPEYTQSGFKPLSFWLLSLNLDFAAQSVRFVTSQQQVPSFLCLPIFRFDATHFAFDKKPYCIVWSFRSSAIMFESYNAQTSGNSYLRIQKIVSQILSLGVFHLLSLGPLKVCWLLIQYFFCLLKKPIVRLTFILLLSY